MSLSRCVIPLAASLLGWASQDLHGAEYFLDPHHGDNRNPGTRAAPWDSLESVARSERIFAGGDVLVLLAGHHGDPVLRGQNTATVTVRPAAGARVTLRSLGLEDATYWLVQGLEISPELESPYRKGTLITITGGSDNVVADCFGYSVHDTTAWTAADWNTLPCNGASIGGTRQTMRGCRFRNVNFGISVGGTACTVGHNVVENFAGDGLRGLGDDGVFQYNVVKNCYKVNANHDDGFQSWSRGPGGVGTGVVRRVTLRGNFFLSYERDDQPFRGNIQGIGCFDGFFEDWLIENNVVITNSWHGIAFYGARNCRIVNNTVVDRDTEVRGTPWIKVTAHKNGRPSADNLVRNNLVSDLQLDAGAAIADHNLVTEDYTNNFVAWETQDLRLAPGSPAIDAGSTGDAPVLDILQRQRPIDGDGDGTAKPDPGAYEFRRSDSP